MGKKLKIFIITACVILITFVLGVIAFFVIAKRHHERCVIRFLYDEGLLQDVIMDEDPTTISYEHCGFVMNYGRNNVREHIKVPCNISENQVFMHELENLGLLIGFYERNGNIPRAHEFMVLVGAKVNAKCRSLQNSSENPINLDS